MLHTSMQIPLSTLKVVSHILFLVSYLCFGHHVDVWRSLVLMITEWLPTSLSLSKLRLRLHRRPEICPCVCSKLLRIYILLRRERVWCSPYKCFTVVTIRRSVFNSWPVWLIFSENILLPDTDSACHSHWFAGSCRVVINDRQAGSSFRS